MDWQFRAHQAPKVKGKVAVIATQPPLAIILTDLVHAHFLEVVIQVFALHWQ